MYNNMCILFTIYVFSIFYNTIEMAINKFHEDLSLKKINNFGILFYQRIDNYPHEMSNLVWKVARYSSPPEIEVK